MRDVLKLNVRYQKLRIVSLVLPRALDILNGLS